MAGACYKGLQEKSGFKDILAVIIVMGLTIAVAM